MQREEFIVSLEQEYFSFQERRMMRDNKYLDFPVERTELGQVILDKGRRKQLGILLEVEVNRDNWGYLIEEMVHILLQLFSTFTSLKDLNGRDIHRLEILFYKMLEELFLVTSLEVGHIEQLKKVYINHMERLKEYLTDFVEEGLFT